MWLYGIWWQLKEWYTVLESTCQGCFRPPSFSLEFESVPEFYRVTITLKTSKGLKKGSQILFKSMISSNWPMESSLSSTMSNNIVEGGSNYRSQLKKIVCHSMSWNFKHNKNSSFNTNLTLSGIWSNKRVPNILQIIKSYSLLFKCANFKEAISRTSKKIQIIDYKMAIAFSNNFQAELPRTQAKIIMF